MFSTDFYASTQEQMNESQKQMTSLWQDYQMKLLESQKKVDEQLDENDSPQT